MARERSATPPMPAELRAEAIAERRAAKLAADEARVFEVAERFGLGDEEWLLALALAAALDEELEHVAWLATTARVSRWELQQHASEVGVERALTTSVRAALARFARFVLLLERLDVVALAGRLEDRTLLPWARVEIKDGRTWAAVLREAAWFGYFGSVATVYETALMFGLSARAPSAERGQRRPWRARGKELSGTQKKENALLHASALVFDAARLASNTKRYTNQRQQARPRDGAYPRSDALHALLAAGLSVDAL